ncbi:MAG TPA: DnaB-like helicase C-terminal domain-containing protein [Gemmatimonadales bacterium]|nr:DnaB-like helicase C-terminal domain-containing protein [Gemmatimonadales bacterium]
MTRRDDDPIEPVERLVARIDATPAGSPDPDAVPSGYPSLDRMLGGGLRRQDLIVLAGDVGSGKSALALGVAVRVARAGTPVLFISGEAEPDRVLERALALEGRASVDDLRQGRLEPTARAAVGAAAVRLRDAPLALRPMLGRRFDELQDAVEMVPPRALVVVDSMAMAPPPQPAARSEERVALVARALKGLAIERDVAVVATAPLPGLRRGRPDPRPTLDDLGGLGTVKYVADVVLAIYREEMYRPGQGVEGATELIVAKNRTGPTGFVDLFFYARWLRFEDLLDPAP